MSKSSFPVPTLQSAYAFTPKFELWMNGIIWQAIYNVVNSFAVQEMESIPLPGVGVKAGSHAAFDIFIQRVAILEDTVIAILEPDKMYEEALARADKEKQLERAHKVYRAILMFLHRTGHTRFKPPRDFADD